MVKKIGLKANKSHGDRIIRLLRETELLDNRYRIKKDKKFIIVPLKNFPTEKILNELNGFIEINVEEDFQERKPKQESLENLLEKKLDPENLINLPKSVDIIGDIAIIELSPEIEENKREVGSALLKVFNNLKTILVKKSPITTSYRVRDYECIAGEDKTITKHKEFGCEFFVNLSKAYFSPRLSFEHNRIATNVNDKDVVVDMFSGVGPFSIIIAKRFKKIKVYAIDINPEAVKFLLKNIFHNKVKEKVTAVFGDAQETGDKYLRKTANRVIMNFPSNAINYVQSACNILKQEGGTIHYYTFMDDSSSLEDKIIELKNEVAKAGREIHEIIYSREIKDIAPRKFQIVIDANIV